MLRIFSLIVAVAAIQIVLCDSALADPDQSLVRITLDQASSQIEVSGRTRLDLAAAVFRAVANCEMPADGVTVGPWLRLPENDATDKRAQITVFVGDRVEGGAKTAYIGIPPKIPFKTVSAIADELRTCGFTDLRLLSDTTVRTEILPLAGHQPVPAQPYAPQ